MVRDCAIGQVAVFCVLILYTIRPSPRSGTPHPAFHFPATTWRLMIAFQPRTAVLTLVLLFACSDDGTRPDVRLSGEIAGTVTRHKTGAALPGVPVVLLNEAGVVATSHTDALGRFGFEDPPAGAYAVRLVGLEVAGVDQRFEAAEPPQHEVTVNGDPLELAFTILTLVPARVTGTVRCGGVPVANARVRVVGGETDVVVTTGAQGQFAALDLAAGNYTVLAEDAPCAMRHPYQVVNLRLAQAAVVELEG